jgi:hypothetical protein
MKKTHLHSALLVAPQVVGLRPNYEKCMLCYLCDPNGVPVRKEKLDDGGSKGGDKNRFYADFEVTCHGQTTGARFTWDSETETIEDAIKHARQHRWFDPFPKEIEAETYYSANSTAATDGEQRVKLSGSK